MEPASRLSAESIDIKYLAHPCTEHCGSLHIWHPQKWRWHPRTLHTYPFLSRAGGGCFWGIMFRTTFVGIMPVGILAGLLLECVVECLVDFNSDGFNFTSSFPVYCVFHSNRSSFASILGLVILSSQFTNSSSFCISFLMSSDNQSSSLVASSVALFCSGSGTLGLVALSPLTVERTAEGWLGRLLALS